MAKPTWVIDEKNKIELKLSAFGKNRILLNGREVAAQSARKKITIPFQLEDGRTAELTIAPPTLGVSHDLEMRVEGQVVLSQAELKQVSCAKCGKKAGATDKFCEKCGAEIPKAETQRKIMKLKGARTAIVVVAGMFFFSGFVMYFLTAETAEKSLANLATYGETDLYPEAIEGKSYTVAELRQQIAREPVEVLVTNLILAAIMFGLYLYAKRSPLAAILMAMGVYMAVIVLNAILDPKTIGQGILIKIIIIGFLVNGIQSALALRKVKD